MYNLFLKKRICQLKFNLKFYNGRFYNYNHLFIPSDILKKLVLFYKCTNQIFPPFNLTIVKPYILSQGDVAKVVFKKLDKKFLVMDNFCHLIIIGF
jgi:hypothetical protein